MLTLKRKLIIVHFKCYVVINCPTYTYLLIILTATLFVLNKLAYIL